MLGCVAMSVALPYQTTLVGLSSGCLSPGFLSGVGLLEKAGAWKWSCEGLVNEQPPAPACGLEMSFSLGETVKFQLAPGFSKAMQCLACPTGAAEGKYSLHVFGHHFCPEGVQSAPQLC
jgi:hypothetical protein